MLITQLASVVLLAAAAGSGAGELPGAEPVPDVQVIPLPNGWMGPCLTLDRSLSIEPGKPLRLRYGLWIHQGVPQADQIERHWRILAQDPLPAMTRPRK